MTDLIQVFLGTKAQYIKTAPLLRLMDVRGVPYRLIDSGQHAALSVGLREELGVRVPDVVMGGDVDITSIPQAALWAGKLSLSLASGATLRREVFGGAGGICVVHGDTPSTLLSTLMARRAGLRVAHLEAGLRSHHLLHPFPEELIRIVVMRTADVLFAPDAEAVRNLRAMRVKGDVVRIAANTVVESLSHDLAPSDGTLAGTGPAIVTMHRVENLNKRGRVERFVTTAERVAASRPVRFVVHGPTSETLAKGGFLPRLERAGVELETLVPHGAFVGMLRAAPLVITDGGSIQEECALLGVPTLLWREHSERPDGIGRNVVVSRYDPDTIDAFLADPERWRVPPATDLPSPSAEILDDLLARL
ncbi:MAG: UDP-N-acetylglucosamine 2-epimerase [Actinobacteria bacterium]|nr:UDP-N-acetylglucosamine 2-epimerase [Actinomycetota bacterium]